MRDPSLLNKIRKEAQRLAEVGDLNLMISFIEDWNMSGMGPSALSEMKSAVVNPRMRRELDKLDGNISGVELLPTTERRRVKCEVVTADVSVGVSEVRDVQLNLETNTKVAWSEDGDTELRRAVNQLSKRSGGA